ncbi:MAG TPA: uracil-DNA glycosylase [Candidatus Nitrosocosmicus sp.]|nr:uracil-DNA glycosylase [Candidatus Nitrosocosmicus sp.]
MLNDDIQDKIVRCKECPRLIKYNESIGQTKVKRFSNENYWAKPIPGYGDPKATLLIVGLAPAAHGGNRTGRIFTGDSSGDWLAKALFETGFANQPISVSKNDGYALKDAYVTAVVKCAPPQNIPTPSEITNCSQHLQTEIKLLEDTTKVILTLGKIAFDNYCKSVGMKGLIFGHNAVYSLKGGKTLISSYHPSRRNTNTKTLTWAMWIDVFKTARNIIKSSENH